VKSPFKDERGAVFIELIVLAVVVAVAGIAAIRYFDHKKAVNPAATPVARTPAATHGPYAGWKTYVSKREGLSFKYPVDWTVKDIGDPTGSLDYDSAEIISPSGLKLLWNSYSTGLGGACDPNANPHVFFHAVTQVPGAPDAYIIEAGPKGSTTHVGIIDRDIYGRRLDRAPQVGDTGVCLRYTLFKSRDGQRDMWLSAPGVAVTTSLEASLQRALTADEISIVKAAMMSLRYN
jgi:Flp pilus assembly pilin Flp